QLAPRQPAATEPPHGVLHVIAQRGAAAKPAVRRGAAEATREHRRLPRAEVESPHESVLPAVGMAARAWHRASEALSGVAACREQQATARGGRREPLLADIELGDD